MVVQTLLSAALMEYPSRRVVLLIDDPPNPADADAQGQLTAMRALPADVGNMFAHLRQRFSLALDSYRQRRAHGLVDLNRERRRVAAMYRQAARWFERLADSFEVRDHADRLFVERVLREPARAHRARARTQFR